MDLTIPAMKGMKREGVPISRICITPPSVCVQYCTVVLQLILV